MEDTKIQIGQKIKLMRVLPGNNSAPQALSNLNGNPRLPRTRPKLTRKREIAQELYYATADNNNDKAPVHMRLGGPLMKRRQTVGGRSYWYQYMDVKNFVKPKLKKGPNGQIMTPKYMQNAQRRLYRLRQKFRTSYQVEVLNRRKKPRFPSIYHSLHEALDSDIQDLLKLIQDSVTEHQVIDNDIPLHTESATKLTLHQRFSSYP